VSPDWQFLAEKTIALKTEYLKLLKTFEQSYGYELEELKEVIF